MPFDKSGKHHMNTQRAMGADKMPAKPAKPPNVHEQSGMPAKGVGNPMSAGDNETDLGGDSTHTTISHNDDGTHSVMHHDGEQTDHDALDEALETIKMKHGGGMMQEHGAKPMHGMPMHEHAMSGM